MWNGELGSIFSTDGAEQTHEYPESIFRATQETDTHSMLVIDRDGSEFELTTTK